MLLIKSLKEWRIHKWFAGPQKQPVLHNGQENWSNVKLLLQGIQYHVWQTNMSFVALIPLLSKLEFAPQQNQS